MPGRKWILGDGLRWTMNWLDPPPPKRPEVRRIYPRPVGVGEVPDNLSNERIERLILSQKTVHGEVNITLEEVHSLAAEVKRSRQHLRVLAEELAERLHAAIESL